LKESSQNPNKTSLGNFVLAIEEN